ncbi:MAG TPA: TetR/AcrR family transcriptional regulator [Polyangiaceae bacterium]|nr:TetR/AcrR family transcriptional regulator [Polyangiaceae bacterium]
MAVTLSDARSNLVRERVLEAMAELLDRGEDLTFSSVAKTAGVPERTLYRHFPTRQALLDAAFAWGNQRIGFDGQLPTDAAALARLTRRVFPGFDGIAPVIRLLLAAPEGRVARLANKTARQRTALALVAHEAPGLDRTSTRRIAAMLQLLTAAATWHALSEYWDMDGAEAAEASVLAAELILEGTRARQSKKPRARKRAAGRRPRTKETFA